MAIGGSPTAFVTDAAGFIGSELIALLVAARHQVVGLVNSPDAADRVRRAGAQPVTGDLLTPGQWQDEAASVDWLFHLSPHPFNGSRISASRAAWITRARLSMDAHLLDTVSGGATRRIVYVADTSCYGATTDRAITEDAPLRPSAWGRCFTPALDRVEGYVAAGLPIVTAFPSWVYGNGSWFRERIIKPVTTGGRVFQFGRTGPLISSIHVHDCARALIHLAERGEIGGRYFVVDSGHIRTSDFASSFARLANRRLRIRRIPVALTPLVAGRVLADHVRANGVFSNIRLRAIGFRFVYPTIEQGIQEILGALHD